jgi:hypothetical protein
MPDSEPAGNDGGEGTRHYSNVIGPRQYSDRLLGYAAGAYGAFCEDFLYGFLYLVIPLYTAYYLVTRWEDLWRWFACSTTGVGLVLFGTQLLRWSGVGA